MAKPLSFLCPKCHRATPPTDLWNDGNGWDVCGECFYSRSVPFVAVSGRMLVLWMLSPLIAGAIAALVFLCR